MVVVCVEITNNNDKTEEISVEDTTGAIRILKFLSFLERIILESCEL